MNTITFERDEDNIRRLTEIKHLRLHNDAWTGSGFLNTIVPQRFDIPAIMMYILLDEKLIGWAYLRIRETDDNTIKYDAGAFINPDHRHHGYATKALRRLVRYVKKQKQGMIVIEACSGTKMILRSFEDQRLDIQQLYI